MQRGEQPDEGGGLAEALIRYGVDQGFGDAVSDDDYGGGNDELTEPGITRKVPDAGRDFNVPALARGVGFSLVDLDRDEGNDRYREGERVADDDRPGAESGQQAGPMSGATSLNPC